MILRMLAVPLIAAAVSGCVRLDMPAPSSESWTLARLADPEEPAEDYAARQRARVTPPQ
jgi:hypothetical protein